MDSDNADIGLPVPIAPRYHDAMLFDLDRVVTDTAALHAAARAGLFEAYDFTPTDYRHFVDGKPRYDGVRDFLASRGVILPGGSPSDEGDDTVCGLGNRKQKLYLERIADGVPTFESTASPPNGWDCPASPSRRCCWRPPGASVTGRDGMWWSRTQKPVRPPGGPVDSDL